MAKPTSKRAQADAAYERAEDQRALLLVLQLAEEGAERYDDRSWIDTAIDRVKAHMLAVSAQPKPIEGELPGQLGIDGSIVGAGEATTVVEMKHAPFVCPMCNKDMIDTFGGSWTPLQPGDSGLFFLQCGHCSNVEQVTEGAWVGVRNERREKVGVSDVKPVQPERGVRRVRGAG